jgi:hypothetical protein
MLNRTTHKLTDPRLTYISEEDFSTTTHPTNLISDSNGNNNYIVVSPCWNGYPDDYYWGDYISYNDPSWINSHLNGINNQQLTSNINTLLAHLGDDGDYNVKIIYISPQRYNFEYIKKQNFTFIELPEYYGEYWQIFENTMHQHQTIGLNWDKKTHHFFNSNKRADMFRQKWLYEIESDSTLKSVSHFSYVCENRGDTLNTAKIFRKYHYDCKQTTHPDDYIKLLPYYTDKRMALDFNIKGHNQFAWVPPINVVEESLIHVVTETFFNHPWDSIFTEKIFKPIYFHMPFVLFSSPGALKYLKNLGFKTFSSFIDESYDFEFDNETRFNMIVSECKRLSCIPLNVLINQVKNIKPILVHNHNRLKELHTELQHEVLKIDKFIEHCVNKNM